MRSLLFALFATVGTRALPASIEERAAITSLSAAQVASFSPYTHYANAVYCQPSTTRTWSCGATCSANPSFQPTASGGDGDLTQFWYVGFDPTLNTVIVAHQGTDPTKLFSILTDLDIFQDTLDSTLFPGISSSIKVHNGFAEAQARTATSILSAVQTALSTHGTKSVTIVGHSLGGAIALLDSMYLPLHLPGVSFRTITYGMPRVGNQAFANYVDAHVNLAHINNKRDPTPIVPGRFLGFHHPSGELHIQESSAWASCPGQDNTNSACAVGDVKNVLESNPEDHLGPYDGITVGLC